MGAGGTSCGLPDNAWLPAGTPLERGGNEVAVTAPHRRVLDCPATVGSRLTALKLEEVISKQLGHPYAGESIRAEGENLSARLRLFD